MLDGDIGPVIPRGYPDLFGEFVDAVDCAAFVASGYHEGFIGLLDWIFDRGDDVRLALAPDGADVQFARRDEILDEFAACGADDDGVVAGCHYERGLGAADPSEIFTQITHCDLYAFVVVLVVYDW